MRAFWLLLPLTLGACGLREPLRPAPGQQMPPAPAMAARPLTTDELLAPPPIARPGRVDELLRRSEEREDDRFDLPPGDIPVDGNGANTSQDARPMKPVRKAVFPVAGLGTRILPATKAIPKEMLTVVDKPLIQYAVEEAREAGIEQMIFVTGRGKGALEDHFDISFELEAVMTARGKSLEPLVGTRFPPGAVVSVRQQSPLGLGHAVWCAREIVGEEPFAVLLPDDLMVGRPGCLAQMVEAYEKVGGNIVCAQEVPTERTASYGIITPGVRNGRLTEVRGLVEKPQPEEAPSRLGIVGRYILQPEIVPILAGLGKGAGGEIQLTDGMAALIGSQPFHGLTFDGERHDCGDAKGFVLANLALGLARDDIAPALRDFLDGAA